MTTYNTGKREENEISITERKRLEAQGYLGFDDHFLSRIHYWLRITPALCVLWALAGTFMRSPFVLWAFVLFALLGAFLPRHPFDVFYNYGLRYLLKGPRIPRFPKPRRFSCLLAATMLTISALAFQSGFFMPGYIIGGAVLLTGILQVSRGICLPSIIYGLIFGKPGTCTVKY